MSTVKLVNLLEKAEDSLRKELSTLDRIDNLSAINGIFSKAFLGNDVIDAYKKELSLTEVSILNSILKLLNTQNLICNYSGIT